MQVKQHQLSVLASKERAVPDDFDMDEDNVDGWYHDGSEHQSWNGGWQAREWYSGNGVPKQVPSHQAQNVEVMKAMVLELQANQGRFQ